MAASKQILKIEAKSATLSGRHVEASALREHRAMKRARVAGKTNAQINRVRPCVMTPLSLDGQGQSAER
jgi:hypothetical protein